MSFHSKYRPKDFKTVVNQSQVVDILRAEMAADKTVSSYIFFGPRGTGKTTTARIFAKTLNCSNLQEGDCCNECEECKLIESAKTLDLIEIDAASNTQVEKVREEIIDKSMYPPTTLKKKVYIIDEVHMLSRSSFNALLKIMEEPPSYLVFILATTEIAKVPETIISRCQVFNFKKLVEEDMTDRLEFVAKEEGIEYDREALSLISKMSDGALRDALKYLEQVSILGKIDTETVSNFLGVLGESQIEEFLIRMKSKDLKDIFAYLNDMQSKGVDFANFTRELLVYLDDHLMENLDENMALARCFKDVYKEVSYYPIPVLAFKTRIGEFINGIPETTKVVQSRSSSVKVEMEKGKGDVKKETKKEDNKEVETSVDSSKSREENSKGDIKQQLVENIDNILVRNILKTFSHIDGIKDGKLDIIIINETQHRMISSPDKLQIVEDHVKKLFGDVKVDLKYMSKEEFYQTKLNG